MVAAIREQAERLLFYSNAVPLESRDRLFALLAEMAPAPLDQAFLVNSGAETNDVALQLARRVTGRRRIVTFEGGFHGRTLATLAASGIPRYRDLADASGGQSLLDLTVVAPWGRPEVLPALIDETIAAVIVEPVQGLAGAREVGAEVLETMRQACDDAGAVLIFDEVQCGCGRTGAFTAAQSYGVTPDILTLAKGIAAGLPMGAVLLSPRIAKHVAQGDLGTTFGGGPIPCASAVANLEVIRDEDLARPGASTSNGGCGRDSPIFPRSTRSPAAGCSSVSSSTARPDRSSSRSSNGASWSAPPTTLRSSVFCRRWCSPTTRSTPSSRTLHEVLS